MSIAADFPDYVFKVIGLRPWDTGVEVDALGHEVRVVHGERPCEGRRRDRSKNGRHSSTVCPR
jgi:hypothetical protein